MGVLAYRLCRRRPTINVLCRLSPPPRATGRTPIVAAAEGGSGTFPYSHICAAPSPSNRDRNRPARVSSTTCAPPASPSLSGTTCTPSLSGTTCTPSLSGTTCAVPPTSSSLSGATCAVRPAVCTYSPLRDRAEKGLVRKFIYDNFYIICRPLSLGDVMYRSLT